MFSEDALSATKTPCVVIKERDAKRHSLSNGSFWSRSLLRAKGLREYQDSSLALQGHLGSPSQRAAVSSATTISLSSFHRSCFLFFVFRYDLLSCWITQEISNSINPYWNCFENLQIRPSITGLLTSRLPQNRMLPTTALRIWTHGSYKR